MVYAFRKLQAMEQQAGGGGSTALSQLFSSHPDVGSRIDRMTKKAQKTASWSKLSDAIFQAAEHDTQNHAQAPDLPGLGLI